MAADGILSMVYWRNIGAIRGICVAADDWRGISEADVSPSDDYVRLSDTGR